MTRGLWAVTDTRGYVGGVSAAHTDHMGTDMVAALAGLLPLLLCWVLEANPFSFSLQDDLAEVEELVIQVKEKTSNIQALSHATVGQYLPVGEEETLSCCGCRGQYQRACPQHMLGQGLNRITESLSLEGIL